MNKLYVVATLTSCIVVVTNAAPSQKCDDTCAKNEPRTKITYPHEHIQSTDTLTREEQKRAVRGEPEPTPVIRTIHQFIAHVESKLKKYRKMLKQVEQEQARNREGTKEKYEAELAKGGPQADGPPSWIFYEKRKEKLSKKIENAEAKLCILKKCKHK